MDDWSVVRLSGYITAGPKSVSAGNGRPLACAAVLQPVPISCHFQGCTVPVQQFVRDGVTLIAVIHFSFSLHAPGQFAEGCPLTPVPKHDARRTSKINFRGICDQVLG